MEAYSLDLRSRIVQACDENLETRQEIADRFGVCTAFIRRLLQRRRECHSIAAKPHRGGFASKTQRGSAGTGRIAGAGATGRDVGGVVRSSGSAGRGSDQHFDDVPGA